MEDPHVRRSSCPGGRAPFSAGADVPGAGADSLRRARARAGNARGPRRGRVSRRRPAVTRPHDAHLVARLLRGRRLRRQGAACRRDDARGPPARRGEDRRQSLDGADRWGARSAAHLRRVRPGAHRHDQLDRHRLRRVQRRAHVHHAGGAGAACARDPHGDAGVVAGRDDRTRGGAGRPGQYFLRAGLRDPGRFASRRRTARRTTVRGGAHPALRRQRRRLRGLGRRPCRARPAALRRREPEILGCAAVSEVRVPAAVPPWRRRPRTQELQPVDGGRASAPAPGWLAGASRRPLAESGTPGARVRAPLQREAAASGGTRAVRFREGADDRQPVDGRGRDVVLRRVAADARRPADAGNLSRVALDAHRRVADVAGPAAAVGGAVVARGVDQQPLGGQRRSGHGELLQQGPGARPAARREDPPRHQRPAQLRRRHPPGLPALRCRTRLHVRRTAAHVRGSRRDPANIVVRERRLVDRRTRLQRPARVVRTALHAGGGIGGVAPRTPPRSDRCSAGAPRRLARRPLSARTGACRARRPRACRRSIRSGTSRRGCRARS